MINVKDGPYKAVGDGKTDDTEAIQEALNDAGTSETVYVPSGTYIVGQLNISAKSLVGERHWRNTQGGTILKAKKGFEEDSVLLTKNNNYRLERINIDATGVPMGLESFKCHNSTVEYVSVFGSSKAAFFSDRSNIFRWVHCIADSNEGIGFSIEAGNAGKLELCTAQHNGSDGFQIRKGAFSGAMALYDCVAQFNTGNGFNIIGTGSTNGNYISQVGLYKSWVEANKKDGIRLQAAHSCYVRDSRISPGAGNSNRCIRLIGSAICEISGTRSAQYDNLDYLKIQIDGGAGNVFQNNFWNTQFGVQPLSLEYL